MNNDFRALDRDQTPEELVNACFLLEVSGEQIGYFRSRENAELAAGQFIRIVELFPPERIACEDDEAV
jgi:hypothetical protein